MLSSSLENQSNENLDNDLNSNVIVVNTLADEKNGKNRGEGLSLREAIAIANKTETADLILFDPSLAGGTIELSEGELRIKESVTIKNLSGENITIDANGESRVFKINDGDKDSSIDVNLENFNITGGEVNNGDRQETGGGIFNRENLTILGVNISDNSASEGGGIDNRGLLNIHNSRLESNDAVIGGAIFNRGVVNLSQSYINDNAFSAIANKGKLEIIRSEIYGNQGSRGGAILNNGEANLIYTKVYNNSASGEGGAIVNDNGKLTVTHSEITDNTAPVAGGGIHNAFGELELSYSRVTGNTTDRTGGGISNYKAIANVDNSVIAENNARYIYGYYSGRVAGGGIAVIASKLNLTNSHVRDNQGIFGGGIYSNSATVNVENTTISDNYAGFIGGGSYHIQTELNLTDSVITGNEGSFAYGGIGIEESIANIDRTTIEDNTAISIGGINVGTSTANITNSTINNNIATELDAGGISVANATANISNSTISNNSANDNGGGVYSSLNAATNISNSTISGNTATDGGGIYQREPLYISYGDGYSYSGTVNLNSTIVAGNTNNDLGGGDFINSNGNNLIGNAEGFEDSFSEANGDLFGSAENPLDPNLGKLQDNGGATETQALLEDSLAIDRGNNDLNLATDQRGDGFDRLSGNDTDIGAYEVQTSDRVSGVDGTQDLFITITSIVIVNFQIGEDKLVFGNDFDFNYLDTNFSGILDEGDESIAIVNDSTIIAIDSQTIVLEGAIDLGTDDILFGITS